VIVHDFFGALGDRKGTVLYLLRVFLFITSFLLITKFPVYYIVP
jgi:hypothetical protein